MVLIRKQAYSLLFLGKKLYICLAKIHVHSQGAQKSNWVCMCSGKYLVLLQLCMCSVKEERINDYCAYVCSVIEERLECNCVYVCSVIEERLECN